MTIKELYLKEFDHEGVTTKKILERVPFEKFDFKPHEKSTNLGRLATHVATLSSMVPGMLTQDTLVFDGKWNPPKIENTADLVAVFEKHQAAARAAIEASTEEAWGENWKLMFGEHELSNSPRAVAFQQMYMSHLIHHRAQLGVFLRLNDVEIPGSYGPSADEPMGA